MNGRILYNSPEVRQAITQLFRSPSKRRIAISAFVGDGANAYLPYPEGIELYCWPKAGGTNPNILRKLMKNGVKVFFANSVHMKVYWSEDNSAIITSANLSTNALGSGSLREVGILLDSKEVDIDRLIEHIKPRLASEKEMAKLQRSHNSYVIRNRGKVKDQSIDSFEEWYKTPSRTEWKIAVYEGKCDLSSAAKKELLNEYQIEEPEYYISCSKGSYEEGEWILCVEESSLRGFRWTFAHLIVPTPKSDKAYEPDNPYQIIQVFPEKQYPSKPFRLDKKTKQALHKAIKEFGVEKIENSKSCKPSQKLINLIHEEMIK